LARDYAGAGEVNKAQTNKMKKNSQCSYHVLRMALVFRVFLSVVSLANLAVAEMIAANHLNVICF
jgi:hypothetical protein